jgi:ribosomal protein S18 acetylase RimI-like enzyme
LGLLRLARLTAADAPAYRTLMLEGYRLAADAFTSTADERAALPLAWWERRIGDADSHTSESAAFGAFVRDALVGSVAIEYASQQKTRHKATLVGMYVSGAHRGLGAGRALVDAALAHARSRPGVTVIGLTVTEGNAPALHLYEAAGFRAFGTEPMAILTPEGYRGKMHLSLALAGRGSAGS